MSVLDVLGNIFTGGAYGMVKGAMGDSGSGVVVHRPKAVDYSDVMKYESDNNTTVALGQIMSQEMSIRQAGMDQDMQRAADLEQGIEGLDTKLQMSKLDYFQQMTVEEDRHVEKLAGISSADFPAPAFAEFE